MTPYITYSKNLVFTSFFSLFCKSALSLPSRLLKALSLQNEKQPADPIRACRLRLYHAVRSLQRRFAA